MREFTAHAYLRILDALHRGEYEVQTFQEYLQKPNERSVILRHDVDKRPLNSWAFAELEHSRGMLASYYFRIVDGSYEPSVIKKISALGHELGYHYEDIDLCNGDVDKAYKSFQENLSRLREIAPIRTACMHGSPLSKHDNRSLWDKYDYHDAGIIGEPYFDLEFTKVFYITDTGRKWNQDESSIRDKVQTPFQFQIRNTEHLIQLIEQRELPNQLMINTHPQRWNDNMILWTRELVWQSIKNQIKKVMIKNQQSKNRGSK